VKPVELRERGGIGGEAEEEPVAELQKPGIAEQQVEAEADQREERGLGAEALCAAAGSVCNARCSRSFAGQVGSV
jgi:hypothetical protein